MRSLLLRIKCRRNRQKPAGGNGEGESIRSSREPGRLRAICTISPFDASLPSVGLTAFRGDSVSSAYLLGKNAPLALKNLPEFLLSF